MKKQFKKLNQGQVGTIEKVMLLNIDIPQMARYHIGVIHERQGQLDKAVMELQRCADEGVETVNSLYQLAEIHRTRGDEKTANELLNRAHELENKDVS